MSANATIETLRSLVSERPSKKRWAEICQVLSDCRDDSLLELALDYTESGLDAANWPDALRVPTHRWLERAGVGMAEPRMRLVRGLVITPRFLRERVGRLSNATWLGNLRAITRTQRKSYHKPLRAWEGFPEFLSLEALGGLRLLDLTGTPLDDDVVRVLSTRPHLKNLTRLLLRDTGLTPSMLTQLTVSPRFSPAIVDLSENPVGASAVASLAVWRESLRRLKLNNASLGDEGAAEFGRYTWRVKRLSLNHNDITVRGVRALIARPVLSELKTLALSENPLGARGGAALATAGHLRRISTLLLDDVWEVEGASLPFLSGLESAKFDGLLRLSLSRDGLGDQGVQRLSGFSGLRRLSHLMLSGNGISDRGVSALVAACSAGALKVLDLRGNRIGGAGVRQLLSERSLDHLEGGLYLQDNPMIDSASALALSSSGRVIPSERRSWAGLAR